MSDARLTQLLQPLIEDMGYEFVGLDHRSNPKDPVLVVYIDRPGGIAVDDCERVSREVAALLDVEDPIPGHYNLEVSSPGLDRPLFTLEQFQRFSGETARVTLFAPQDGRRKFKGRILGADDGKVKLDQDVLDKMVPVVDGLIERLRGGLNLDTEQGWNRLRIDFSYYRKIKNSC